MHVCLNAQQINIYIYTYTYTHIHIIGPWYAKARRHTRSPPHHITKKKDKFAWQKLRRADTSSALRCCRQHENTHAHVCAKIGVRRRVSVDVIACTTRGYWYCIIRRILRVRMCVELNFQVCVSWNIWGDQVGQCHQGAFLSKQMLALKETVRCRQAISYMYINT